MAKPPSRKSFSNPTLDEAVGNVSKELTAAEMRSRADRRLAFEQASAERAARIRAARDLCQVTHLPRQREGE